jgi:hypothetical protein
MIRASGARMLNFPHAYEDRRMIAGKKLFLNPHPDSLSKGGGVF